MTQCKTKASDKQEQMAPDLGLSRKITQDFDGGDVCTDGGLLILRKADERLELCELASLCLKDPRSPEHVQHQTIDLLRQRVYAIAAGYEDCNDATKLRHDAMHRLAVGVEPNSEKLLASQPTMSRFEGRIDEVENKAVQSLLVHLWIRRHKKPPKVFRMAMDTTCDPVYGYQQLSFWNGFYGMHCYAPLLIFTDCGFPLCALLRPGNPNVIDDALRMLKRIVHEVRLSWPQVRIELTADAGFNSPEIFEYCETNAITYFIGVASHSGLAYHAESLVRQCKTEFDSFGYASPELKKYAALVNPKDRARAWRQREERIRFSNKEEGRMQEHFEDELFVRRYGEFRYQSREWKTERRFIVRVHYTLSGPDVRFIVTNSKVKSAREVYDDKYCRRARCENWIKDLKTYLKSDRTSCQEFEANQFRLFEHVFAYILIWDIRKRAKLPEMTVETFRLQLLKIGVLVETTRREIALRLASNFVWRDQFRKAWFAP